MNKIIKYINENEIADMVRAIISQKKDINEVLQQIRLSRVEYQTKSQHLQWALEKYVEVKVNE